jgi:uncharacterized membrane protein (UPF0127 family)
MMNPMLHLLLAGMLLIAPTAVPSAAENNDHSAVSDPPAHILEFRHPEGGIAAVIRIEIADQPATRARGLMGRTEMPCDRGMLFIFERTQQLSFWMHNTLIPLDMFFIDEQKTIFHIVRQARPMSDQIYSPVRPGRYVVETCAGFAQQHAIVPGMRIQWQLRP